jgi:hypothetical protein
MCERIWRASGVGVMAPTSMQHPPYIMRLLLECRVVLLCLNTGPATTARSVQSPLLPKFVCLYCTLFCGCAAGQLAGLCSCCCVVSRSWWSLECCHPTSSGR